MLRDFRPEDQSAVRDLVLAGLEERWGDAFDPSFNPDLDDIAATYVTNGADVVVADVDGQIVACGILRPEPDRRGRILRLSVDRDQRRRRLGRRVVGELVGRARDRGMSAVVVSTDTPWSSAVDLYRSCGFDEVGRDATDTHFMMPLAPANPARKGTGWAWAH